MIRRLVLHAGLPKTGTSALQRWFHDNRPELARCDIEYPERYSPGEFKQQFVISAFKTGDLKPIQNLIERTERGTLLLSTEGLSNHFFDIDEKVLSEFRALTKSISVSVILLRRETDAWLRSFYKQALIAPPGVHSPVWGSAITFDEFCRHPLIRRLVDFERLQQEIARGYGADMILYDYEDDWLAEIIKRLELDPANLEPIQQEHLSIQDCWIELVRRVNDHGIPLALRTEMLALLRRLDREPDTRVEESDLMSPQLAAVLTEAAQRGDPSLLSSPASRLVAAARSRLATAGLQS